MPEPKDTTAIVLPPSLAAHFSEQIITWQRQHGRNQLPWQQTRDPYRVWLSEIMLQQTQVVTVLAYFTRFLERFPDVTALAAASEDAVFALWSGLGYYSRARNMLRCAQEVVARFQGEFPRDAITLATLPGIGRSTAAAIAAFCFGERVAILDGNVKRVLARVLGYGADLSVAAHERALWSVATVLLPAMASGPQGIAHYTQGLMDLGATVCTPRKPRCGQCPVVASCTGHAQGEPERYPVKLRKLRRSAQSLWMLIARDAQGRTWLQKRPTSGIWAGLHCLPVFESRAALDEVLGAVPADAWTERAPFVHVLTHKDLHLHPVVWHVDAAQQPVPEGAWFETQAWRSLGLPAPVRKLLDDF